MEYKNTHTKNKKDLNSNVYGNTFRRKEEKMKKEDLCAFCGSKLIEKKDITLSNGKSITINVMECEKCGESFSTLKEVERVRKELHPAFWEKIKNFFTSPHGDVDFLKGKVL